jgi:hypothetical protein
MKRSCRWLSLILLAFTALLLPASASSHWDIRWYSFENDDCVHIGGWVDPVNVIFYYSGTIGLTGNHIEYHLDWGSPTFSGVDTQWFKTHETCLEMDDSKASATIAQTRYHVRLKENYDFDATLAHATFGTAHFEDIIVTDRDCEHPNHAVRETVNGWSGYDEARRRMYNSMRFGHESYIAYRGNTRSLLQCDEQEAASNGYARYFHIPASGH